MDLENTKLKFSRKSSSLIFFILLLPAMRRHSVRVTQNEESMIYQ